MSPVSPWMTGSKVYQEEQEFLKSFTKEGLEEKHFQIGQIFLHPQVTQIKNNTLGILNDSSLTCPALEDWKASNKLN